MRIAALAALTLGLAVSQARASFVVTYGPAGQASVDKAALCGTTGRCDIGTETFDARSTGRDLSLTTGFGLASGRITGRYQHVDIMRADIYGGAGHAGNYAATFGTSGYSLSLSSSVAGGINYFGFWLSALDRGNDVAFLSNGRQVFSFTAADVRPLVGPCDGNNPYCGNPLTRDNPREAYVFLNFFDIGGSFDTIVFSESPTAGGYESDNHTVGHVTRRTGTVVTSKPREGHGTVPVPEPRSLALIGTGLLVAGLVRRRPR